MIEPLENETYTKDELYHHYISTVIARRIARIVHDQIRAQWPNVENNRYIDYPYDIEIPQYVVTFDSGFFSIYECK